MNIAERYSEHKSRYFSWMFERQRIWWRRYVERVQGPLTDDPILLNQRYTNVYRELDRGTLYSIQHVIKHYPGDTFQFVFLRTLTYRIFNKVATYDKIFRPVDWFVPGAEQWPNYKAVWEQRKLELRQLREQEAIFTNAHVVPTFGAVAADAEHKSDKVMDFIYNIFAEHWDDIEAIERMNFADAHKHLMKVDNLGDFLAYEVLSDLAYTDWVTFDEDEWANAGPGARDGLKLLYPVDTRRPLELMRELQSQQVQAFADLGLPIYLYIPEQVHHPRLTLRNIEGGLCEYFKYNGSVSGKRRLPFRVGEGYVWK